MKTITITEKEYDEIVKKTMEGMADDIQKDHPDDPMLMFLIPLAGGLFARKMQRALFGEDKQEEKPNHVDEPGCSYRS